MKALIARIAAAATLTVLATLLLVAATTPAKVAQPDKLIILSTTDVKGKNGPCG